MRLEPLEARELLTLTPLFLAGDVNHDRAVDIFDVNLVSDHWRESGSAADVNGDGHVDIFDVNAISDEWTGTLPTPPAEVVPRLEFQLDASDLFSLERRGAAMFGAEAHQYLTAPDTPALRFTDGMSASFWANQSTLGVDRNFLTKWTYPTQGGWAISTGGFEHTEDEIQVWFTKPSGSVAAATTDGAGIGAGRWYHIAVTYNGAGATNEDRLQVYVNGVAQTLKFVGGDLPAQLAASAAPLNVGKWGGQLDRFLDGSLASLGLWPRGLSAVEVQALWNQGMAQQFGELSALQRQDLAAWWDLEQRIDAVWPGALGGIDLSDPTGVSQRQVVPAWSSEVDPQMTLTQSFSGGIPDYLPTAFAGRGGMFFDGVDDLLRKAVSDFANHPTGDLFLVVQFPDDLNLAHFNVMFSSADEDANEGYMFLGTYPVDPDTNQYDPEGVPKFRIRWRLGNEHTSVVGSTIIEPGASYLVHLHGNGPNVAYDLRVNQSAETLHNTGGVPQDWYGSWYDAIPGRDNVTAGGLRRMNSNAEDPARMLLGEVLVFEPGNTAEQNLAIEQYLAEKWGLTVPSPGGASAFHNDDELEATADGWLVALAEARLHQESTDLPLSGRRVAAVATKVCPSAIPSFDPPAESPRSDYVDRLLRTPRVRGKAPTFLDRTDLLVRVRPS